MFRISSHLHRNSQSGILYFRLTVPSQLRHILHKREVKISIGTGQRSVALPIAQGLYCKYYLLFRSIRGELMPNERGIWGRIFEKLDSPEELDATEKLGFGEELDSFDDVEGGFDKTTIKVNGYPLEGYRRLTFMMLDKDIVAVSPSSTYRILSEAGLLAKWNNKVSKKGTGFKQPLIRLCPPITPVWHRRFKNTALSRTVCLIERWILGVFVI